MQDGDGLRLLRETITATVSGATNAGGELADLGARLNAASDRIADVTRRLWRTGDAETALANASIYLEAVGHIVVAWIWLEQLLAAQGKSGDF
jgi:hypothetical protein